MGQVNLLVENNHPHLRTIPLPPTSYIAAVKAIACGSYMTAVLPASAAQRTQSEESVAQQSRTADSSQPPNARATERKGETGQVADELEMAETVLRRTATKDSSRSYNHSLTAGLNHDTY